MATAEELLTRGRDACTEHAWTDAYHALTEADELAPLDAADLDRLALAAHLTGRIESAAGAWERAHEAHAASQDVPGAVRSAFWMGLVLALRGEHARAGGWLARAQHMLEDSGLDCVEKGYLRLPAALQALGSGDHDKALEILGKMRTIAGRFGDRSLQALGVLGRAQALIASGDATAGVAGLDEAMVTATTGDVSPVVTGIVYCAVIIECRRIFDWSRAYEWTAVLSRWCSGHQDLKPYRGQCLVHRSELMQLRGEWADAMDEIQQACEHLADPPGDPVMGMAQYQMGELLGLRGDYPRAEAAYREATNWGHPAQPGMALLRLAQDRHDDASAAIKRAVNEADGPVQRAPGAVGTRGDRTGHRGRGDGSCGDRGTGRDRGPFRLAVPESCRRIQPRMRPASRGRRRGGVHRAAAGMAGLATDGRKVRVRPRSAANGAGVSHAQRSRHGRDGARGSP